MKKFSLTEFTLSFLTPHPARDWLIALSLSIAVFLACASYAGYLFWGIRAGTIVGSAPTDRPVLPKVSRADLANTLEAYRVRKANYDARNFPRPVLTNPAK